MATLDITRLLPPGRGKYVGARVQQGRPLTDFDVNEGRVAETADRLATERAVIGAAGSPDDGFMPELSKGDTIKRVLVQFGSFIQSFVFDYRLRPGTMYVGGRRFEVDEPEPVIFQREYLQMGPATAPRAAVGMQHQLSYLHGFEQPVSAVEDAELMEPALHGAEGGTRMRRTGRVEVRNVESTDGKEAFSEVLEALGDGASATYDSATGQLKSNARLQLRFFGEPPGDCVGCEPALRGQYLGNEDHCVRLMLASADSFVWAYDNAAPLYRAKLVFDGGGGATVHMLNPPKDLSKEPVLNQVVEFLPLSVLLKNGRPTGAAESGQRVFDEKLASIVGFFGEVDQPYEQASRTFHARLDPTSLARIGVGIGKASSKAPKLAKVSLKSGEPLAEEVIALEWDRAHPHAASLNVNDPDAEELVSYVYLRVWHVKKPGEPLTIPVIDSRPLGRTGLVPIFVGKGRRGDYWRATLRTDYRSEILPRALMQAGGVPPDGPIEVVAPLSLVTFSSDFGNSHRVDAVRDCRRSQPALTSRGCQTYVVGNGGFGDFSSIQEALDALPKVGGRISVLAGTYVEELRIAGRGNVRLTGCPGRTVIESPSTRTAEALIDVVAEPSPSRIRLEGLTIRARGQLGVRTNGPNVELHDLDIEVQPDALPETPSAVRVMAAERLRMMDSRIVMNGGFSDFAAVDLDVVDGAVVEGNRILAPGTADVWGGLQIRGGGRRIDVRDNEISGGRGHNITLGSAQFRATDGSDLGMVGPGLGQSATVSPFALSGRLQPVDRVVNGATLRYYPEPDPTTEDLLIADNRLLDCRGSGIGSLAPLVVHESIAQAAPLCIRRTTFVVERLTIRSNRIEGNARGAPGALGSDRTRGGVVLSEVRSLAMSDNRIASNGAALPPGPACGIYLASGRDVVIENNQIVGNGSSVSTGRTAPELSGAIILAEAANNTVDQVVTRNAAIGAVSLRGNFVTSPWGPALSMAAGGWCSVTGNHFEGQVTTGTIVPLGAAVVTILVPARTVEAVDLEPNEPSSERWDQPSGSLDYLSGRGQDIDEIGGLVFSNNQVGTTGVGALAQTATGVPVLLVSTGSVVMLNNQLRATASPQSFEYHCWVIGTTVNVSGNRVAETLDMANHSLVVMGAMMTVGNDNILTHCGKIYGCENDESPEYFVDEGNLVWLSRISPNCAALEQQITPGLQSVCRAIFGPVSPPVPASIQPGGLVPGGAILDRGPPALVSPSNVTGPRTSLELFRGLES